jgi:hypothetical protein
MDAAGPANERALGAFAPWVKDAADRPRLT